MIDYILLFPYWLTLKLRHSLYDSGIRKSRPAEVPTVSIGNVTVGGTGKTPHTEMILRTLMEDEFFRGSNISVLSRGYKRTSKGFQNLPLDGTAGEYGDEPMQIKKKFPFLNVAVCKDRNEGCHLLRHPEEIGKTRRTRKCRCRDFEPADMIVLDDAFQYRALKPTVSIVLVDYNHPVHKDHLMPLGKLRDLPSRLKAADIIIVSKCPAYLEEEEKQQWISSMKLREGQKVFFTTVTYCPLEPIYPEGETRYLYSKKLVLFTGIANDRPLRQFLSGSYKVVRHLEYPDHHRFTHHDMMEIKSAADAFPTAIVTTTEKDSQRVKDCQKTPESLKQRLFRAPIQVDFLSDEEKEDFRSTLLSFLR